MQQMYRKHASLEAAFGRTKASDKFEQQCWKAVCTRSIIAKQRGKMTNSQRVSRVQLDLGAHS